MSAAQSELNALEARALDGEDIAPAELAVARERVRLEDLRREGETARNAIAATKAAAEAQAAAKADVADLFATAEHASLLPEFDAAVRALNSLVSAVDVHNALVDEAAFRFGRAGVPSLALWAVEPESDIDPANFAAMEQGLVANSVTVDGVGYVREIAGRWLLAAIHKVARDHGGLPVPGGVDAASRTRADLPAALHNRPTEL